eukprot:scaffold9037_cov134-Skeletonema_dohrnii-CCMP3373.AAC.3
MTGLFARFGGFDVGTSTSFASSSAAVVLGAKVCIGVGELKSHHFDAAVLRDVMRRRCRWWCPSSSS